LHIKKLGVSRSYRESCGEFLCDGLKLLEEAVRNEADVTNVLASSHIPFPLPLNTRVHFADRSLVDYVSPLTNSQGILFTCKFPQAAHNDKADEYYHGNNDDSSENSHENSDGNTSEYNDDYTGTHVLLDGVQDPGNVGAIIRTANAFGIRSVMLTGDCADPYNPKTIRATMGAIFRQKICIISVSELADLKDKGLRFIGSASHEQSKNVSMVKLSGSIIAIGSEGRGLSGDVLALCDEIVRIPIMPECESLNAAIAAAIIIYLARG